VAGKYVFVFPEAGQSTNPAAVMTDPEGRAWFVLEEPGTYRAVSSDSECVFDAQEQPLTIEPGYEYIQWVALGD